MHRDGNLITHFDVRQLHQGGVKDDALGISHLGNGFGHDVILCFTRRVGKKNQTSVATTTLSVGEEDTIKQTPNTEHRMSKSKQTLNVQRSMRRKHGARSGIQNPASSIQYPVSRIQYPGSSILHPLVGGHSKQRSNAERRTSNAEVEAGWKSEVRIMTKHEHARAGAARVGGNAAR